MNEGMKAGANKNMKRFLNPQSIAVIGGIEAERVLQQSQKLRYSGAMWAINPSRHARGESLAGIACLADIDSLPEIPDAVFIGIPAEPTIEMVKRLREMGVGGAVVLASGFSEVDGVDQDNSKDSGSGRQKRLIEAAGAMPVLGPNCYGYINTLSGAALFPDQHGLSRTDKGVAIISSSGNIGINFTLQRRSLPISWLITVGNQAVTGIEELVSAALYNEHIRAIGLHIEGLKDMPLFIQIAARARDVGKPIIVLKTGKSALGARITLSHTATLAGEADLYAALFRRIGVALVNNIEEFLEALKLAYVVGPLAGNHIASMSCSGGEASLIADLSAPRDLVFPAIQPAHKQRLRDTLNQYVAIDNPLDYHTFIWGDEARMCATFSAMMVAQYDITILLIDYPHINDCDMSDWLSTTRAFIRACRETNSRGAVVTCLSENYTEEVRDLLIQNGIAPLQGMDQALAAIEALSGIGSAWARSDLAFPSLSFIASYDENWGESSNVKSGGLDEYAAKKLLQKYGAKVPVSVSVSVSVSVAGAINDAQSCQAIRQAASVVGYPLVIKAIGAEILHKSELGAVVTGIHNEQELMKQAQRLFNISDTLLVEEMIEGSVAEVLLGVSHDRLFGHYLILGFGGTMVELIKDREILFFPLNHNEILNALKKLKTWSLLDGFRGAKKADIEGIVDCVNALILLLKDHGREMVEIEINPLMVGAKGGAVKGGAVKGGAVVADALIIFQSRAKMSEGL